MPDTSTPHPINSDWKDFYILLEGIRQSGICNMYGAAPVLSEVCGIRQELATKILLSWITNYAELKKLYWPNSPNFFDLFANHFEPKEDKK